MADNVLTRKLGPLPTWGWMGIGTAAVGGIALYLAHKQGSSASTAASTDTGTTSTSNVPDYVFQNYNQLPQESATPATAAATTTATAPVTGTIGAGGQPAAQGLHSYTSNGKLTLAEVAKQHNTTPAAIVASTHQYKNNISKTLESYLSNSKDWSKPIPKGTIIVYQNGSASG